MSNRTVRYTAGEIGRLRVIEDFLPPPADLVPREDNVKVTLSLSRRSLDFFKRLEASLESIPVVEGELYLEVHRATYTTHGDNKKNNRRSEFLLRNVEMLAAIGVSSLEELIEQTVPASIRFQSPIGIGPARGEFELIEELRGVAAKNAVLRSCIGMGYSDTITPPAYPHRSVLGLQSLHGDQQLDRPASQDKAVPNPDLAVSHDSGDHDLAEQGEDVVDRHAE